MKDYTNDFSQFYRDLYKEQILIESCSKLFKKEIEAEYFRFQNQVLPNLFETDSGWLKNNSILNSKIIINKDNKEQVYNGLLSYLYCQISTSIFEKVIVLFNRLLLNIYESNNTAFDTYLTNYILNKTKTNIEKKINNEKKIILKNLKSFNLESKKAIDLLEIILSDDLSKLIKEIIIAGKFYKIPFKFIDEMRVSRNDIIHRNKLKNDNRSFYIIKEDESEGLILFLDQERILKIIDTYKNVLNVIFHTLNLKFNKNYKLIID